MRGGSTGALLLRATLRRFGMGRLLLPPLDRLSALTEPQSVAATWLLQDRPPKPSRLAALPNRLLPREVPLLPMPPPEAAGLVPTNLQKTGACRRQ
eukprot:CAMPEP_0115129286 /NCGR_PEP_ID=MMETSP0227-20121206/51692_1 /TAXON_ID=89957 /ORGANISM="Polarella glacialis, Strain CCMP 1383" /LENGTH=95 /DNA_ID=CAMNT_0002534109 /DNA_START=305 /DNA_END=589 /DNA_ORIENTATION=-